MVTSPSPCIIHWLKNQLSNMPKISLPRGETIEHTISESLRSVCKYKEVSIQQFSVDNNIHLLKDTGEIQVSRYVDIPIIILQPCGKQQWPDMYIIFGHRGIPIEFKTSRSEKITWNSGLPRIYGIYILNGHSELSTKHTTYCMGSDLISQNTKTVFVSYRNKLESIAKMCNTELKTDPKNVWSLYPRPMHGSTDKLLSTTDITNRELNVIAYLERFDWESAQRVAP
jgi:hypothetical protein